MKLLKIILVLLVLLLVGAFFARDFLIKKIVTTVVAKQTGFDLEIGYLRTDIFNSEIEINDLQLANSPDFIKTNALVVNRIFIKYELASFWSKQVRFPQIQLDLDEVVLVRNADGTVNLEKFAGAWKKAGGGGKKGEAPAKVEPKDSDKSKKEEGGGFWIGRLTTRFGQAKFIQTGALGLSTDLKVDETRVYKDVTGVGEIITDIVTEIMAKQAMSGLNKLTEEYGKKLPVDQKDIQKVGDLLKNVFQGDK